MVAPEALGEYRAIDTGNADNGDSNCQYKVINSTPPDVRWRRYSVLLKKERSPIKIQFDTRAGQSWNNVMPYTRESLPSSSSSSPSSSSSASSSSSSSSLLSPSLKTTNLNEHFSPRDRKQNLQSCFCKSQFVLPSCR